MKKRIECMSKLFQMVYEKAQERVNNEREELESEGVDRKEALFVHMVDLLCGVVEEVIDNVDAK